MPKLTAIVRYCTVNYQIIYDGKTTIRHSLATAKEYAESLTENIKYE